MGGLGWFLYVIVVPWRKILHLEYISTVRETVLCDHVLSQCRICMNHIDRLLSIYLLAKFLAQAIDARLDLGLESPNRRFGEEITEGGASSAVKLMANSPKGHISAAKHARRPRPFLYILRDCRIELVYEVRVHDVKLVGIDADDWTYRVISAIYKITCVNGRAYRKSRAFSVFSRRRNLV